MSNNLQKIAGGTGCDIVTAATSPFRARKGKMYGFVVREDSTNVEYIKEYVQATEVTVTSRSWIGGESTDAFVDLNALDMIVPDYPMTEISLTAGSIVVYYEEYFWKHFRR